MTQLEPAQASVDPSSVIAIDGPAGSGKSTTARALAHRLGLLYVDTGAMYRALTWAAHMEGVGYDDGAGLFALLETADLELGSARDETTVTWNGRDISKAVRTPEIEAHVSAVAAHADVRALMVEKQRQFARRRGVVMEGRDIGTVVFPLASAKIYLDASLEARADRRQRQYRKQGEEIDFEDVLHEVEARDRRDREREESPLSIAPDAVVVDNSNLSFDEQLHRTAEAVVHVLAEQAPRGLSPDSLSAQPDWRYSFFYALFTSAARHFGLKIYGREHVEFDEGKIVAANHVSNWDPPMLAASLAGMGHFRAVAKEELFRLWPLRMLFTFMNCIPIKRNIYDAQAFDLATQFLHEGQNVVFFPEGMRRVPTQPGPVRNGLGALMQASRAPAVPVFFRGTVSPVPGGTQRSPLEAHFAPPVRLRALPTLLERHSANEINRMIGALFENIYREMQARSFARIPMTPWEAEVAGKLAAKVRRKEAETFKKRSPES